MDALLTALVSILLLTGTTAQAQGMSREQAVQSLSHVDAQTRRREIAKFGRDVTIEPFVVIGPGVSIADGGMLFTVIPSGASSTATARGSASSAAAPSGPGG